MSSLADERKDYEKGYIDLAACPASPLVLFEEWMKEAMDKGALEPTAMTLSTCVQNRPSSRIVLLKGLQNNAFRFYTNKLSQKGQELKENPYASLVFFWPELERQIRVEGKISELPDRDNDEYFHSRPFKSQLGAAVSNQSTVISDREVLESEMTELTSKYEGKEVPRPKHWGGFAVEPERIEFWQGRRSRLHDRINYRLLPQNDWFKERLAP